MRTYGVNLAIWFVAGIWIYRKSRQIRFFLENTYFISFVRNIVLYHDIYEEVKEQKTHKYKNDIIFAASPPALSPTDPNRIGVIYYP